MRTDIAQQIRRLVPAREAAEHYGFTPDRGGYIVCPFHNEKTASLKFYDDGGWFCFGCRAGGTSIDFVMRLFDLDFRQTLVRLDMDFSLGLTGRRAPPPSHSALLKARREEQKRRAALLSEIENLTKEHYRLHRDMQLHAPSGPETEDLHPLFAQALKKLPDVQYRLEELENELRRIECGKNRDPGISA